VDGLARASRAVLRRIHRVGILLQRHFMQRRGNLRRRAYVSHLSGSLDSFQEGHEPDVYTAVPQHCDRAVDFGIVQALDGFGEVHASWLHKLRLLDAFDRLR
jgi:hypothetical protein